MGERSVYGDYNGVEIRHAADLDYVPFSDLYNSNLLEFFVDEAPDEFVQAENEEALKNVLEESLGGVAEDFLETKGVALSEDPRREEMFNIIKQELPVLLQFTDAKPDWEEIYRAFDFKDLPVLPESSYLRLFLRDKLMALLNIDAELFKDTFFYYNNLAERAEPVRRADIITIYKQARSASEPVASMRLVKQLFDELVTERRKQL